MHPKIKFLGSEQQKGSTNNQLKKITTTICTEHLKHSSKNGYKTSGIEEIIIDSLISSIQHACF